MVALLEPDWDLPGIIKTNQNPKQLMNKSTWAKIA
jgi:hypothetical protein